MRIEYKKSSEVNVVEEPQMIVQFYEESVLQKTMRNRNTTETLKFIN